MLASVLLVLYKMMIAFAFQDAHLNEHSCSWECLLSASTLLSLILTPEQELLVSTMLTWAQALLLVHNACHRGEALILFVMLT